MSYDYSQFKEDSTSILDAIVSNAELMQQKAAEVEELEKKLSRAKTEFRHLAENVVPELLEQAGLDAISLKDGKRIVIEETLKAGLTKDKAPAGLQWLRDHGHDAIIKTKVISEFVVGQDEQATELYSELAKRNSLDVKLESSVHWATLTKTVKELLEAGEDVPLTLLGVERLKVAKVK